MAIVLNPNRRPDITFLILFLIAVIIIFLLNSCSCDYHYSRLSKKCQIKQDTLIIHDTLITKESKTDTIFKYYSRDTVVIKEGKLTMKYFYNNHDSTVYLNGMCAPDTIIREIRAHYNFVQPSVDYFPNWLKWSVITLLLLVIIRFILKKFS